jgi:hypothetical protein
MSNDKGKLKDSIRKSMRTPINVPEDRNAGASREDDIEYGLGEGANEEHKLEREPKEELEDKARKKKREKPLKVFGAICIAAAVIAMIFSNSPKVDTSESARNALENRVSTAISAGTVLSSADENIGAADYTITHKTDTADTKIWVWDYAAEDGDYVQILVNGVPITDSFMIKNKPREIIVPAVGEVQVKGIRDGGGGIRDGGGGITYAVRYEINGTSYFNGAPEGEFNTYTLVRE